MDAESSNAGASPGTGLEAYTPDQLLAYYVQAKDGAEQMANRHKVELKPVNDVMALCLKELHKRLLDQGIDAIKSEAGTVFLTTQDSVSLEDPAVFLEFVKTSGQFELLDIKANKTSSKDFLAAHNQLPPGVKYSSIRVAQVRRPKS